MRASFDVVRESGDCGRHEGAAPTKPVSVWLLGREGGKEKRRLSTVDNKVLLANQQQHSIQGPPPPPTEDTARIPWTKIRVASVFGAKVFL